MDASEKFHELLSGGWRSVSVFYFQTFGMVAYVILAFVLPPAVEALSEAAHIASLHAALFACILLAQTSSSRRLLAGDMPLSFPLTPMLALAPAFVSMIANAILLPVLGLESWLQVELGEGFSVLLMVQVLAVAEGCAAVVAAAVVILRGMRYSDAEATASFNQGLLAAESRSASTTTSIAPGSARSSIAGGGAPTAPPRKLSASREASNAPTRAPPTIPAYLQHHDGDSFEVSEGSRLLGTSAAISIATAKAGGGARPSFALAGSQGMATSSFPGGHSHGPVAFSPSTSDMLGRSLGMSASLSSPGTLPFGASTASINSPPPTVSGALGGGGGTAAPQASPASTALYQSLVDRVQELVGREADLVFRIAALSRELVAAASSALLGDLPGLYRRSVEENSNITARLRHLEERCHKQQERLDTQQSEMERVNSELSKLRQQVREEKRKAEKASQNLEHEIALNQQAQAVIRNLQQQISGAPMQSSGVSAYSQSLEAAMAAQGSSAPRTSSMLAPGATRPAAVRAERRIVATAAATSGSTGGEGGPASAANALGTTAFTSPDTSMTGSGMQ